MGRQVNLGYENSNMQEVRHRIQGESS